MEHYDLAKKLIWALAATSTASCLIRNDYNVIFAFLVMTILIKYYKEHEKFYSKVIIHLMGALIAADLIWIIIVMPYWTETLKPSNKYWDSLSGVHSFALWMCFVGILLKVGVALIFVQNYKTKYNIADLMKLTYDLEEGEQFKNNESQAKINSSENQESKQNIKPTA